MKTTVTLLCENTAGIPLGIVGEHGFSALIERGEESILFDTGQGIGLLPNAAFLGKDLSRVKKVILSHGHYDHTRGLAMLIEKTPTLTVFGHPDIFRERFAVMEDARGQRHVLPVGLPYTRKDLESKGATFDLSPDFREVAPGLFASGEIPRPEGWKGGDSRLVVWDGDRYQPDPFRDDLSLVLQTEKGPVILLGCAHAGLVLIIRHLRRQTGFTRFHAILGGTHLGAADKAEWEEARNLLQECQVENVATSHCTGFQANCFLASRLGERVVPASAGTSFEF